MIFGSTFAHLLRMDCNNNNKSRLHLNVTPCIDTDDFDSMFIRIDGRVTSFQHAMRTVNVVNLMLP